MDEQTRQQILALRDEELYHARRAEEARQALQQLLQRVGPVEIVVQKVQDKTKQEEQDAAA